jgi:hypothetical protein
MRSNAAGTIRALRRGLRRLGHHALHEAEPSADVPDRTCLVRVGDTQVSTRLATYRIWMSDDVVNAFRARPNLSNELLDCTFVYNNTEVFYNCGMRFRGSPFIRGGGGRDPRDRYAYRIEFNPDQKFRALEEINLDNTEGTNRGPLQERASYWFYAQMGLQYSRQEWIRMILTAGTSRDASTCSGRWRVHRSLVPREQRAISTKLTTLSVLPTAPSTVGGG